MRSLCALAALLSLTIGLAAAPALAVDDADWGLIETTPGDWPLSVYLPDYGELTMVGYEGSTREDVTDPFDFEWTYEAEEGSGDIYMIQAFFVPDGEAGASDWDAYNAAFIEGLEADGVEVVYAEPEVWYGGRRWMVYNLLAHDEEEDAPLEVVTLVNLDSGGLLFFNFFYDTPVNEDFDGMLSLILGGPDAPQ